MGVGLTILDIASFANAAPMPAFSWDGFNGATSSLVSAAVEDVGVGTRAGAGAGADA